MPCPDLNVTNNTKDLETLPFPLYFLQHWCQGRANQGILSFQSDVPVTRPNLLDWLLSSFFPSSFFMLIAFHPIRGYPRNWLFCALIFWPMYKKIILFLNQNNFLPKADFQVCYFILSQLEGAHKKIIFVPAYGIFSWSLRPTLVPGILVHTAYVWHPWCCFFCFFSQRLVYFASRGPRKLNFGMPHCFDPTKRKMFLKIKVFVCGHLWVFSAFKS